MKHIATLLFLGGLFPAMAQQAPQYSLFALNPYAYNPAYAGLENTLVATGVYRRQWSGLEGAPETQHLNAHLPLYVINSGIGLKIENDVIGAHRTTQGSVSYNYQLELGRNTLLSAGIGIGFLQYSLDGAKLRQPLPGALQLDCRGECFIKAAVILDGRVPHAMLVEIFTDQGAGTLVHK